MAVGNWNKTVGESGDHPDAVFEILNIPARFTLQVERWWSIRRKFYTVSIVIKGGSNNESVLTAMEAERLQTALTEAIAKANELTGNFPPTEPLPDEGVS